MAQLQRTETPTRFKTTVQRQIVLALRDVFETSLYTADFPSGVNVVSEYPLSEIKYPAIVVTFNDRLNENAGVGHTEEFEDVDGQVRTWQHRRFEGEIELTAVALDPVERDILSDAIHDIVGFSHLSDNAILNAFFLRMNTTPDNIGTVFQTNLNTDQIQGGGTSVSVAPWQPEDVLLYEATYTVQAWGGFYNTILEDWPGYVVAVDIDGVEMLSFADDIVIPDPDTTPGPVQLGHGFDTSLVLKPTAKSVLDSGIGFSNSTKLAGAQRSATDTGHSADGSELNQSATGTLVANRGTVASASFGSGGTISTNDVVAVDGKLVLAVAFNDIFSASSATVVGGGLTWNLVKNLLYDATPVGSHLMVFVADAPAGLAGSTNIVITTNQFVTRFTASLEEWSGLSAGIPPAGHVAFATGNGQSIDTGATVDAANNGDGVFCAIGFDNEIISFGNWTAGTDFTKDQVLNSGGASPVGLVTEYDSGTTPGTKHGTATTTDAGQAWGAIAVILAHA